MEQPRIQTYPDKFMGVSHKGRKPDATLIK